MLLKLPNDGHVAMVDDNAGDVFFVHSCYVASKLKHPWLSFSRGADFLEHLKLVRDGLAPMPALVLLDVNMPGMTGIEVLQATREDLFFADMPIFCILTSSSDPRDAQLAKQLGASGFCTKASSVAEYIAFFDSLL